MKIKSLVVILALYSLLDASEISDKEFFGKNRFFSDMMYGEGVNEILALKKNKKRDLETFKNSQKSSGLKLKLGASDRLDHNFKGYSASVVWDLFDDGYFGLKKESKKRTLEYNIYQDEILSDIESNYLRAAIFEIDEIKNYIQMRYNQKKLRYIKREFISSKKKLQEGLITKYQYNKMKNLYKKARDISKYDGVLKKKIFDKEFKNFVLHIEDTKLWDEKELIQYAKKHNSQLNAQKSKIKKQKYTKSWVDDIDAHIYLSKRRYTFIDREDTVVGAQVELPLEAKDTNKIIELNQHILKVKLKSEEVLLQKRVHHIYTKFLNDIDEIKYRLSKLDGFIADSDLKKAQKLETKQDLWGYRCEALKDLFWLQFLTSANIISR